MSGLFFIIAVLSIVLLIMGASITPRRSALSRFELNRRKDEHDETSKLDAQRSALYQDIVSLQRAEQAILLVVFVLTIVGSLGWLVGSLIGIVVALEYGMIARLPLVRKNSQKLYDKYESGILQSVAKYQHIIRWIRIVVPQDGEPRIDSKDELEHIINSSDGILTNDEKLYATHVLKFDQRLVSDVMTPRSVVETVKKSEILGPLVLDDLHKKGHSRFPVVDNDIDHIVGILYLRDLVTLDTSRKHTSLADTAMDKNVFYIHQDQTLAHALAAFLKTHHHLFIVVNEFRETVGIVTLEDTIETLLGKKIVDEFDAHDDLRAVAERNPRANNSSKTARDV